MLYTINVTYFKVDVNERGRYSLFSFFYCRIQKSIRWAGQRSRIKSITTFVERCRRGLFYNVYLFFLILHFPHLPSVFPIFFFSLSSTLLFFSSSFSSSSSSSSLPSLYSPVLFFFSSSSSSPPLYSLIFILPSSFLLLLLPPPLLPLPLLPLHFLLFILLFSYSSSLFILFLPFIFFVQDET